MSPARGPDNRTKDSDRATGSPSTASTGGASHNHGRQNQLASDIDADLTPFPCCWCPSGGTHIIAGQKAMAVRPDPFKIAISKTASVPRARLQKGASVVMMSS